LRCGAHLPALKQARRQLPIEFYAAEQLSRRFGKIKRRGRKITKLDPEKLHKFRIQVKKARYAAEFFSSIYGDKKSARRRKKVFSSLTQLQNSLGRINDIATHKALFTNIVDNPRRGLSAKQNHQRAFAAGLIIGDQQARVFQLWSMMHAKRTRASIAPSLFGVGAGNFSVSSPETTRRARSGKMKD
jgi:CHAD domain-containing protein